LGIISYSREDLTKVRTVVDKVKASEVFNNLFGNAIKYRKSIETLRIRVTAEVLHDAYLIRISDDGIGIDPGCDEKIFDESFRGDSAVRQAQGSGLGLWLARQYLREMDGDVTLEKPRNPTVFCVRLPKREQP
jgi:signal transduction histidine kinase